jgi:predicted TIM-barrel fold metal-dependent hydrolase
MPLACGPLLGDVDLDWMRAWWSALLPDVEVGGMLMGFPTADVEVDAENAFVAESARAAGLPFALLVRPDSPIDRLEKDIQHHQPAVLKPYMCFVRNTDPAQARIVDLIPEPQLALADQYGLAVMLHVSKPRGMADADNLNEIARLAKAYPRCQFILAHCGRCFIAPNMDAALDRLPVADNIWLDTSAVCDLGVFMSLLRRYDRSRIMFGTDLVTAAAFRGSYARLGMGWHLLTAEMVARKGGTPDRSTFAAYESLAALCRAMQFCNLSNDDRNAVFYGNAARLFGLEAA